MPIDRRKALVIAAAIVGRILVFAFFPQLPELLTGQVEVSTPVSSYKRLQEGLFLYIRNVSPYEGGIFHQAPLLLPLFSLLPGRSSISLTTGLLYTLMDLANANALAKIADSGEAVSSRLFTSPRKETRLDGAALSIAYLFNPFTIAGCFGRSTSAFTNTAIVHAVSNAVTGSPFRAMFALALASYLSMYPILLFPPLALLCWDQAVQKSNQKVGGLNMGMNLTASLFACINGFLWLSFMVMGGSWDFLSATYGFHLSVPDLTPNVGLWWYFFIEIFDSFREFFLGTFWLQLAAYVGGLTLRVRRQPLFVITSLLGLFAIFKPYPSISDVSLYLAFVPLYRHIFPCESFQTQNTIEANGTQ
ncbi:hypothetical protein EPUS_06938 [Endocarpon pusillum Z07020]|uniref:GPI transamidase component PIG-U n=1 Tax=Endocarpon pusillum (strain Z07020 / HMAS-L-300199) TaxID=1263415 RepID=U1FTR0_ENDPU|nr:uncharacterized protein EPUS_06938 [Endocarpon pusillum Z07020]ERF68127.1 hypothetical protein EPUS_06938 [Endocarpon pusillum Z07020]